MTQPELKQAYAKAIYRVFKYMALKKQIEVQSMVDHMDRLLKVAQAEAREIDQQRFDLINKVSGAMAPDTVGESKSRYA